MDSDRELLRRVNNIQDFAGSVLLRDALDDWTLARDLGEFLVRLMPDSEIVGHALLTRAHRHLGNLSLALAELKECQARVGDLKPESWESRVILPFLREEEKLLSTGSASEE